MGSSVSISQRSTTQEQQQSQQSQGQGQREPVQQSYQPPIRLRPFHPARRQTHQHPHYPPAPPPPTTPQQQSVKTTTIKNQVNLRKKSVKVDTNEEGTLLIVSFEFDAAVPCSVTTFFGATEMPKEGNRLAAGVQTPGERIYYVEKSEFQNPHKFPPQNYSLKDLEPHQLDLSLFTPETLQSPPNPETAKNYYPIIIRLECLASNNDMGNALTLNDLSPGESLPRWVQAQTTYAYLHRDSSSDKWSVQVVKQKIWVSGSAYVLQDIYGIEGGEPSGSSRDGNEGTYQSYEDDDLNSGRECVVCLTAPRDTAVLPCRHFCMCQDCAKEVYRSSQLCPICRIKVGSLLSIKMENKQNGERGSTQEAGTQDGTGQA